LAAFALDNAKAYEEIGRLNRKLSEEALYYREEHLQNSISRISSERANHQPSPRQVDQVSERTPRF